MHGKRSASLPPTVARPEQEKRIAFGWKESPEMVNVVFTAPVVIVTVPQAVSRAIGSYGVNGLNVRAGSISYLDPALSWRKFLFSDRISSR